MALIHCSIAEFCNPLHKLANDSMPTTESMTSSLAFNSSILALNTERSERQSIPTFTSELVVPESVSYELDESEAQSEKRLKAKRCHATISKSSDEEVENNVKRARSITQEEPKIQNKDPVTIESSDEEESAKPPPAPKRPLTKINRAVYVDSSDDEGSPAPKKRNLTNKKKPLTVDVSDEEECDALEKGKEIEKKRETRSSSRLKTNTEAVNITKKMPEKTAAVLEMKNITNEPSQNTKTKSKSKTVLTVASDQDDDELFTFSKPPEEPSQSNNQGKPVSKSTTRSRISVVNFLEKSQPQETQPTNSQSQLQSQTQPRKRLRLEPLNESDSDDGENLFNFAGSQKKKKNQEEETKNDSNDGSFNFNSVNEVNQDSVLTEPFPSKIESKTVSKYVMPRRKEVPRKVDVSGWLSGSRLHQTIKTEATEVKLEKSIKEDPDEDENDNKANLKWEISMKDSIQVKMCNLNISHRSQDEVDGKLQHSESKYADHKNFKKFVKVRKCFLCS